MSPLHLRTKNSVPSFASGSTKNCSSRIFFVALIFVALTLVSAAHAHTPKPGQIAQHQARRLQASKQSFKQAGTVLVDGKSYPTELKWYAPGSYDFVVSGLPSTFTGMAGSDGLWTLKRRAGNRCVLIAGTRQAQCGPAQFWAMIELSAQPEAVGGALVRAGIYGPTDTVYDESHSNAVTEPSKRRVQLVIGRNGDTPKAVMRIRAPGASAEAGEAPYIDFDQNFLVPLYAQFSYQGAPSKIKAYTELAIDREQPRYSHVMASSLSVSNATENLARFTRKDAVLDRALKEDRAPEGLIQLSALQESLGTEAGRLMTAILLTH